jgi:hypothetical protein
MIKEEEYIKSNTLEAVKKLVANVNPAVNIGVNKKLSETGCTLLHYACLHGKVAIAEYLIQKNADVNAQTKFGCTPIHWAAQQGSKEIFQLLIGKGANIRSKTVYGYTALHYAMLRGSHVSNKQWKAGGDYDFIIKYLLSNGLSLETITNNQNNSWSFMSKKYLYTAKSAKKMLIVLALDPSSTLACFNFFETLISYNGSSYKKQLSFTLYDNEFRGTALSLAIERKRSLEIINKIVKIMYPNPDEYIQTISTTIAPLASNGDNYKTSHTEAVGSNNYNAYGNDSMRKQPKPSAGLKVKLKLIKGKGLKIRNPSVEAEIRTSTTKVKQEKEPTLSQTISLSSVTEEPKSIMNAEKNAEKWEEKQESKVQQQIPATAKNPQLLQLKQLNNSSGNQCMHETTTTTMCTTTVISQAKSPSNGTSIFTTAIAPAPLPGPPLLTQQSQVVLDNEKCNNKPSGENQDATSKQYYL